MTRLSAVPFLLLAAHPVAAQEQTFTFDGTTVSVSAPQTVGEDVTTFTLNNGMQVVVIEDHRAAVAVQMVWYRAGSADEPVGQSGVAHFLEHLLFKGTDTLAPGEFSSTVAATAGRTTPLPATTIPPISSVSPPTACR